MGQPPPPPPPPPPSEPASASASASLAASPGGRTVSSAGALWVAGLGAFLLVAAAATFVAVRWDDIPAGAKLAALVAVTLTCLQAHLRLRASLPSTATVLLHLGVLLVPIDVAALGVRFGWDWPTMLLAQGVTATLVFGVAARVEDSVVLRAATWLGVVVLAGGIGGLTVAPAGLVLAGAALAAVAARRPVLWLASRRPETTPGPSPAATAPLDQDASRWLGTADLWAAGWAVLAGLAMPLAAAEALGVPGAGVLTDLGLTGDENAVAAGLTGLVAGVVLGVVGGRRRSLPAALAGIGCVLAGATTAWVNLGPDSTRPEELDLPTALMAGAAVGLVAQLAAWAWRGDPFWCRPTGILAGLAEVGASVVTLGYVSVGLVTPLDVERSPQAALAAGLVSLTWLAATARRVDASPSGESPATAGSAPTAWPGSAAPPGPPRPAPERPVVGGAPAPWPGGAVGAPHPVLAVGPAAAAVAACAAVTLATASGLATAWALTLFGGAVVLAASRLPRDAGTSVTLGVGLLSWSPGVAYLATDDVSDSRRLLLVGGLGLAGAIITAASVAATTSSRPPGEASPPPSLLAPLALLPLAIGAALVAVGGEGAAAATLGVVGVWLTAAILDLAELPDLPDLGELTTMVRAAGLVPLALTLALLPEQAAAVAGLAAALALLDALRRDQPRLLVGTAAAVPIVAGGLALHQGTTLSGAGLVVTLTGVAWLGLAGTLPRRWTAPALVGAVVAGGAGFVLCLDDRAAMASWLLVAGTALAAVGVAVVQRQLIAAGAIVATIGFWSHLSIAEVTASEPYVAPAALLAVAAGMSARQRTATAGVAGPPDRFAADPAGSEGLRRPDRPAPEPVSSWIAYAPSVALLGGSALAERLAGGPAWHALVAGAVGILAVGAGGLNRLAGPLLLGTVLVVAVTVHETLGVTAQFPTWVWLASGGALLLGAGIAMERRDTGPVETGKRLVDLVREQFT